jgi:hypothetical protein
MKINITSVIIFVLSVILSSTKVNAGRSFSRENKKRAGDRIQEELNKKLFKEIYRCNLMEIKRLIKEVADVNAKNDEIGESPLHYAASISYNPSNTKIIDFLSKCKQTSKPKPKISKHPYMRQPKQET